jgi:hypothetical protein
MSKLPSLTGNEVIKALEKAGFEVARIKGSHHIVALRELTWRNPHLVFYVERELWNDHRKYCVIRGLWITQFASR